MLEPNEIDYDGHTIQYFDDGQVKFIGMSLVPVFGEDWADENEVGESTLFTLDEINQSGIDATEFNEWADRENLDI